MTSVLNTILRNRARALVDFTQLNFIPKTKFSEKNLRLKSEIDLASILSNPDASRSWDTHHDKIKSVYGDKKLIGGVNSGDRRILYYHAMALSPKNILEIGTNIGCSTLYLASALKQIGGEAKITSVDIEDVNHPETGIWKKIGLAASPREMSEQIDCSKFIDFRTMPSLNFLTETDQKYDLIFIDGDHRAKAVYREVSAALPLLNSGGIIMLHDYYPFGEALFPDKKRISGPFQAFERISRENQNIIALPIGQVPWTTKQNTNLTSLAIVVRTN